jgi:hypothetical protein
MKLKAEMLLTAATAKLFVETAERLADQGDDGLLAATVLMRISESYARSLKAQTTESMKNLNAEDNE